MHEHVSQIQQGSLPVFQGGAQFMTVAIEALGPHRCCGGRDIACAILPERGRSLNLGVATLFHFGAFSLDFSLTYRGRFVWGKALLRQGRGLEFEDTNCEPFALVAEPRCR